MSAQSGRRQAFTRLCPASFCRTSSRLRRGLPAVVPPRGTKAGFTLIELLLVIGIIAVLASIVITAINPSRQLVAAQDAKRRSTVNQIQKAFEQYLIDHGSYPSDALIVEGTDTPVCREGVTSDPTCIDITTSDITPTYVASVPTDPLETNTNYTGFAVTKSSGHIQAVALYLNGSSSAWTCGSALVDSRDAKSYATVLIGGQCWMAQNINVGTLTAGAGNQGTSCASIQKYCYDDSEANCTTYGGLYQWDQTMCGSVVAGAQGICPTGWHVPTHDERTTLERAVCTSGTCVTDFPYDTSTTGWRGTNEGTSLKVGGGSGFEGLLAGFRSLGGTFADLTGGGYLWTSSQLGVYAWYRDLHSGYATVYRDANDKLYGFSMRCLED